MTASGPDPARVDLRSDTVTRPSAEMRRAMAEAEVGDDVLGDDPTTRLLEERVASLLGKERALFFPSGVMANQTALAVLGRWGGEIVVEAGAHVLNYEEGAAGALSGVQLRAIAAPGGMLTPDLVRGALRPPSRYLPRSCAVSVENTHMDSGGRIMPLELAAGIGDAAREHGLPVHLDGARLWNACAATGTEPAEYARHADTVMVSLSKALGCPVGSMLAGTAERMEEAWRIRRRLGGGMRQSGILAAAGLYALEHHRGRIADDHARARRLARGLDGVRGITANEPETNVVFLDLDRGRLPELLSFAGFRGILLSQFGPDRVRAVTHRDVDDPAIERALECLGDWARAGGRS